MNRARPFIMTPGWSLGGSSTTSIYALDVHLPLSNCNCGYYDSVKLPDGGTFDAWREGWRIAITWYRAK